MRRRHSEGFIRADANISVDLWVFHPRASIAAAILPSTNAPARVITDRSAVNSISPLRKGRSYRKPDDDCSGRLNADCINRPSSVPIIANSLFKRRLRDFTPSGRDERLPQPFVITASLTGPVYNF